MSGKLCTRRPIGKQSPTKLGGKRDKATSLNTSTSEGSIDDDLYKPGSEPGQHFHMDFGFVRGGDYCNKTKSNKTVTSKDNKRAYLIVVDRSSRYTWVYLTASKLPPIEETRLLLNKFKSTNPHRTVRVDQGGELGKSAKFQAMIGKCGFQLEQTGSDSSAQNGIAESPNRVYGQMMRCLLYNAELGSEYWSWALQHAVYIKNRLYHSSIKSTPYQQFTGIIPDLSSLLFFRKKLSTDG